MRMIFSTLSVALFLAMGMPGWADRYVSPEGGHDGAFSDWTTAATNIQAAISVAGVGETVWVTNGTYTLSQQISIGKGVTVQSTNGAEVTFVDGNYPFSTNRCFEITHPDAVLDGFTVTNGCLFSGYGAGIRLAGGTVRNCTIADNTIRGGTGHGGGLYVAGDSVLDTCIISNNAAPMSGYGYAGGLEIRGGLMTNCVVTGNTSRYNGAGIYVVAGNEVRIVDSLIASNTNQSWGAGIHMANGLAVIERCTITNNSTKPSGHSGGGIHMTSGKIRDSRIIDNFGRYYGGNVYMTGGTVEDCTVSNGDAGHYGGGIYMSGGTASMSRVSDSYSANGSGVYMTGGLLTHSIIDGNSAYYYGGGVRIEKGTLRNCLILGNASTHGGEGGAGVYLANNANAKVVESCTIVSNISASAGAGLKGFTATVGAVTNSILYGNTPDNWNWDSVADKLAFCSTTPTNGLTGPGIMEAEPVFVASGSATNYYRLAKGSPGIDAGATASWMTDAIDLLGQERVLGPAVDIGAFEYRAPPPLGSLITVR